MPLPLVVVPPLILAAVLIASGIAKLRHPDDLAGWASLGIPAALRRSWLLRAHPWGEILLALALALLGGILGILAALAAVALMAAYLWLVARALARSRTSAQDASCACFGAERPVTTVTVVRNAWLLAVAVVAAVGIGSTPLWGGAVAAADGQAWLWIAAAGAAALTAALILWPSPAAEPAPAGVAPSPVVSGDDLDYIRTRTPAVPVTLADGTVVSLRKLVDSRPILLLAVSTTCGSCQPVIDSAPAWREVLPEVDIRFLLQMRPETSALVEREEPQSVHDPEGYVNASIADWATPSAVLLGVDGLLAGGPVTGSVEIEEFIHDIRASIDEAIAAS